MCRAAYLKGNELGGDGDGVAERFESWTMVHNKVGGTDGEALGGVECDAKSGARCAQKCSSEDKAEEGKGDGEAVGEIEGETESGAEGEGVGKIRGKELSSLQIGRKSDAIGGAK